MIKLITRIIFISFIVLTIIGGCNNDGKNTQGVLLRKIIVMGDSLAAGMQSFGLERDFQENSIGFLISRQVGKHVDFEQPLIAPPGIGIIPGTTPQTFENGQIILNELTVDPVTLLLNPELARPYNNLGIPSANVNDVINTVSSPDNMFFDIVLRNRGTELDQAIDLNPSLILISIGANDVSFAALSGGNLDLITPEDDFASQYRSLLTDLRDNTSASIVVANIFNFSDIPFFNFLDQIFQPIPALGINTPVPVVFDTNFKPIDFGGFLIPLLTEESDVVHLLFQPTLGAYQEGGEGIPDEAALIDLGFSMADAQALVSEMQEMGLNPTGIPLTGNLTLTKSENDAIQSAIDGYNATIADLATEFKMPVANFNALFTQLNTQGIDGFSGGFVLQDPVNTAFSLDGIHPDNAGYALMTNLEIGVINDSYGLNIPFLDTEEFRGQYASMKDVSATSILLSSKD
jgi:lysophospholipase L1-like esterase